ncbi:MAG: serine/threonine protein kinase, partial [Cyanobacteria bacterium]|nr:serine/threonine protein kinase [Cyanobacteriota bacterium]
LVAFRDFGITQAGMPYIVMDYVEGETLAERIERRGVMDVSETIEILLQALAGLQHAHERSILHRDIKPSNIILSSTDVPAYVKILDFGIARIDSSTQNVTQAGQVFGTPHYISPEQGIGKQVDARSDLYSMGCVMYEALTGKIPLVGNSAIETIVMRQIKAAPPMSEVADGSQFDPALEKIVARMLAIDPDDRFRSAEEAGQALLNFKLKCTTNGGQNKIIDWAQFTVKAQTSTSA